MSAVRVMVKNYDKFRDTYVMAEVCDIIAEQEMNQGGKKMIVSRKIIAEFFGFSQGYVSSHFSAARNFYQKPTKRKVRESNTNYSFAPIFIRKVKAPKVSSQISVGGIIYNFESDSVAVLA